MFPKKEKTMLEGHWNVNSKRFTNVAAVVLAGVTEVDITSDYTITTKGGQTRIWAHKCTSDDDKVIWGEIDHGDYRFVISVGGTNGQSGILGIIYGADNSDTDPGTWEADESGGGEG